jgi:hypothetical protein
MSCFAGVSVFPFRSIPISWKWRATWGNLAGGVKLELLAGNPGCWDWCLCPRRTLPLATYHSKSHWSCTSIILRYESIWYHMHINILNLEFSPNSKCFCCFCTSNVSSIPSSPWNLLCSVTIWTYSPCPDIPLCPESWWYTSSIHAIVHNSYFWDFANLKFIMNPWCEIQFSVQFHTLQHFNKSEVFNLYTWWFRIRTPGWSKTPMSRKVSCWPKPISGRTRLDRCCTVPREVHGYQMRYSMLNLPKDPKDTLWLCQNSYWKWP